MSRLPTAFATRNAARLCVLVVLLGAPCVARAQDSLPPVTPPNVGVVRPGDALHLAIFGEPELSGEYLIDGRGIVQIPGLGDIQVTGLNPYEVKDRLREHLIARGNVDPSLSVQLLLRVAVLGEVRSPGPYSVEPGASLLQLLSRAGGPTERADMRRTQVVREGRAVQVDLQSALAGSVTGRYVLNSSDVLYIPRKRGLTRETWGVILSTTSAVLSLATFLVTTSR
ncbi:MAG TPA: polysaccharide biosynthesis/export family protein [Gemmatimonadaceae bacterium]|nr:polysaccharide biosynthesis/export family protein [Gemmatimonadaceae bacterium]